MVSRRERDEAYDEFLAQELKTDYGDQGAAPWEHEERGASSRYPPRHAYDNRPLRGAQYRSAHRQAPRYKYADGYAPMRYHDDYPPAQHQESTYHEHEDHPSPSRYDAYPPRRQSQQVHHYRQREERLRGHSERHLQQSFSNRYPHNESGLSRVRSERHAMSSVRRQDRSNHTTPSPPREVDSCGVNCERQWEVEHRFADRHPSSNSSGEHYSSPEEVDDCCPDERHRHPTPSRHREHEPAPPTSAEDNFGFSKEEEEEQHRAFALFRRMQQKEAEDLKQAQLLQEEEDTPSRKHEKIKVMTQKERLVKLRHPSPIPKPPPPPAHLKITHRPEIWDPKSRVGSDHSKKAVDKRSEHSSSKSSWEPPYPFYASSESEHSVADRKQAPKNSSNTKTSSSMGSKSDHRKMPSKTDAVFGSFHPMSRQTPLSESSGKVGAFCEKPQIMVEIQPGFSLPLRGSEDTMKAVKMGMVIDTFCMVCTTSMIVASDCNFVICPVCRVVGLVENVQRAEGEGNVGLGLLKEVYEASLSLSSINALSQH